MRGRRRKRRRRWTLLEERLMKFSINVLQLFFEFKFVFKLLIPMLHLGEAKTPEENL